MSWPCHGIPTIPFPINTQFEEHPTGGIAALGGVSRVCCVGLLTPLSFLPGPLLPPNHPSSPIAHPQLSMMQAEMAEPSS